MLVFNIKEKQDMANEAWWERYYRWQEKAQAEFLSLEPNVDVDAVEVCENGDVFVGDGGAYPIHYRGVVTAWKD